MVDTMEKKENNNSPINSLEKLTEKELQEMLSEVKSLQIYKKKEMYTLMERHSEAIKEAGIIKREILKLKELVNQLSQKSSEIRKELEQYRIARSNLDEERRRLYSELRNISSKGDAEKDKLLAKLMKLKWIHQTTPLPPDEELNLIDKIAELEKKSLKLEKMEKLREKTSETESKINELLAKREVLIEELIKINTQIRENKKRIKNLFVSLIEKSKQIDQIKQDLFRVIKEFAELKDQYNKVKQELVRRRINIKARVSENVVDVEKEIAKSALEKYKAGKKLDLYELQLLYKQMEEKIS
jgi:uncharacterized coiled-coil DUF342 family protein